MSRKVFFIILFFFIIGLGFLGYQFLKPAQTTPETPVTPSQNPFGTFFPTENTTIPITNNGTAPENQLPETMQFTAPIQKLRQISANPVAGSTVFDVVVTNENGTTTSQTKYRYIEKATGHVYEAETTQTSAHRISNTTIPKIQEAFFFGNKDQIAFRYLDKDGAIDTYVATIKATTTPEGELKTTLEGIFMQKNISTFAISPNGTNLLAFSPNSNVSSASKLLLQIATNTNVNKQATIFNSPLSIWTGEWFNNESIALTTTPSYNAGGLLYTVNARTGAQNKIIGPINGLSVKISPNGRKVLYSKNNGTGITTNIYNIIDNVYKIIPIATLADKCVWSRDNIHVYCAVPTTLAGQLPDVWYMGLVSFNDSLVKINTELETVVTVMSANTLNSAILDMTKLQLSPKEDYLIFTNKNDLSLWSLDIKQD